MKRVVHIPCKTGAPSKPTYTYTRRTPQPPYRVRTTNAIDLEQDDFVGIQEIITRDLIAAFEERMFQELVAGA